MARYLSVPQWLRWALSYPMLALDTQLPNACFGRQASPVYTYLTRDLVSLAAISVTFGDGLYLWNVFGAS